MSAKTRRGRRIDEDSPKYQVAIARGVPVLPKLNRLSFAVQKSPHFPPLSFEVLVRCHVATIFSVVEDLVGQFLPKFGAKKTGFPPRVGDVLFSNYNLELPPTQDSSDHPDYSIFSRESIPITFTCDWNPGKGDVAQTILLKVADQVPKATHQFLLTFGTCFLKF